MYSYPLFMCTPNAHTFNDKKAKTYILNSGSEKLITLRNSFWSDIYQIWMFLWEFPFHSSPWFPQWSKNIFNFSLNVISFIGSFILVLSLVNSLHIQPTSPLLQLRITPMLFRILIPFHSLNILKNKHFIHFNKFLCFNLVF